MLIMGGMAIRNDEPRNDPRAEESLFLRWQAIDSPSSDIDRQIKLA
jgi:hypothetical protein